MKSHARTAPSSGGAPQASAPAKAQPTSEDVAGSTREAIDALADTSREVELDGTLAAAAREVPGRSGGEDWSRDLRSSGDQGGSKKESSGPRPPSAFHVLGQTFSSLSALQDWLMAEAQNPASTVPHEPVLNIDLTPGSIIHEKQATTWHYYNPNQQINLNGNGAVVSGLRGKEQPTPGFFLSYRPAVGHGTTAGAPAKANFQMTGLTVRGYESGGVELSPQREAGKSFKDDGGLAAFLSGAVIEGNRFEQLGSLNTPYEKTTWSGEQRYGVGGILARGVSGSRFNHNVFDGLENGEVRGTPNGPLLIHAVYARDHSSGNQVVGNRFQNVSGDPVRFCNGSNDNRVTGNTSKNAGKTSMINEFYNPTAAEVDSVRNTFADNKVGNLYGKNTKAKLFTEKVSHGKRPKV
jgi:hypothetical protein